MARPTVMTPEVVSKLEQAFSLGCTDLEACLFADISKQTLYDYQDKYPEFIDRKEQLKENPVLLARTSVIKHMQDDGNLAIKYLERKRKDEFSPSSNVNVGGQKDNPFRALLDSVDTNAAGLPDTSNVPD